MANVVTLTLAGDTKSLDDSFKRVGDNAKDMSSKVKQSGDSFDRVGEKADDVDTKAMGFRDTLTGIQDSTKGIKEIAKGNFGFESLLLLGAGIGDLGSGLFNFLVPAFKKTVLAVKAMNLAFLTSPVFWIIAAVVALVVVIVLIATKTNWFQRAWKNTWSAVKSAFKASVDWIKQAAGNTWDYLKKIPGWLRDAFKKISGYITAPFRSAFNYVADAWNNTIGRLSWSVPGWVPGIGGNSISVPNLPHFHAGGVVGGVPGTPTMALLQAGERVSSVAGSSGDQGGWVAIRGDAVMNDLIKSIASTVGAKGGRAAQLGIKFA